MYFNLIVDERWSSSGKLNSSENNIRTESMGRNTIILPLTLIIMKTILKMTDEG